MRLIAVSVCEVAEDDGTSVDRVAHGGLGHGGEHRKRIAHLARRLRVTVDVLVGKDKHANGHVCADARVRRKVAARAVAVVERPQPIEDACAAAGHAGQRHAMNDTRLVRGQLAKDTLAARWCRVGGEYPRRRRLDVREFG